MSTLSSYQNTTWLYYRSGQAWSLTINLVPLQAYHNAHLEAIKGFGMHGYEIDFEVLVEEYQVERERERGIIIGPTVNIFLSSVVLTTE